MAAVAGCITGFLWLSDLSPLQQIKAQSCRKSSLHSVLSSKLGGDVAQLKQKAQVKKNLSGTDSRDKDVSGCNSNPNHGHRSQSAAKAESRRESGGQSDTGLSTAHSHALQHDAVFSFFPFSFSKMNKFILVLQTPQQPVWTVSPKRAGLDLCAADVKKNPAPWHKVLPT